MSTGKSMKDTIYVDVDDEITSIIDKVEGAKHKIVALVLPKRAASLQSIVNMRLLKRSSEKAAKNVVLITNEPSLMPLAGAVGMYVAKNLQTKPEIPPPPNSYVQPTETDKEPAEEIDEDETSKIDYNKPIGELAAASELDDSPIDLDDETAPAAAKPSASTPKTKKSSKLKVPNFERFRLLLIAGIAGVIGLVVFAIFAIFILPKAEITVKTASQPVSANFRLTTSDTATELDEAAGILPASLKTADQESTQQVPATGQKNNGVKASGTVKFSIPCSSVTGSPPKVPAGTGVSTNGLTFITQKTAELDNAEFTGGCKFTDSVSVVAQQAGVKYNVGPSTFTMNCSSCSSGISISSSAAMTGGTDDIVTVVSQQDVETAKQKVSSADSDEFSRTFQQQLEETGFYVLTSTLKLSEPATVTTPEVGQPASSVTVTVKISYTVLVVPRSELEKAVENKLKEQIDQQRQKLSKENVLEDLDITIENQTSPTKATLVINQETTAVPVLDINAIKAQVAGKKRSEIETLVKQYPGVESVGTKFSPFWVSKAPSKPDKVKIKLEEVKADDAGN
jgi:hypothetical protein